MHFRFRAAFLATESGGDGLEPALRRRFRNRLDPTRFAEQRTGRFLARLAVT